MLENETCDSECMSLYWSFDKNACGDEYCNSDQPCNTFLIGNDICDEACSSSEEFNYDGEDCLCAPGWYYYMREDEEC